MVKKSKKASPIDKLLENKKVLIGVVVAILVILGLVLILTLKTKTYKVNFDTVGGNSLSKISVKEGETLKLPEEPKKEGFKFNGWLLSGEKFDETKKIEKNMTLTASWEKVKAQEQEQEGPTCPKGYETYQGKCRKLLSTVDTTKKCQTGYSLTGTACTKTDITTAKYACPSGKVELNGKCYSLASGDLVDANPKCQTGYTFNTYKGLCVENVASINVANSATCPSYNYVMRKDITPARCFLTYSYACTIEGVELYETGVGTVCVYRSSENKDVRPICPTKTGYGTYTVTASTKTCHYFKELEPNKTCKTAGNILSNGKCYGSVVNKSTICPSGYKASGSNCSKTTSLNPTYSCPSGYTQNGTKCLKYDIKPLQ